MEKNYMKPDTLVELEFLEAKNAVSHTHENIELLFVLEGSVQVKTDQRSCTLGTEDYILINANRPHSYKSEGALLAVRFLISATKLREHLQTASVLLWCCSVGERSPAHEQLRRTLKEILLCSVNQGRKDDFYLSSLHFRLLSQLIGNFLLDQKRTHDGSEDEEDRMERILAYIQTSFRSPISLQDVADELYLSPTYLSKYIRRQSGKGFVEVINAVRLSHAMEDLMYTDHQVTRIALDNGFASVAALNKVFKDTYQATPSEYRKAKRGNRTSAVLAEDAESLHKVAIYLHQHYNSDPDAASATSLQLNLPAQNGRPMRMRLLLNAGRSEDLLKASTQRQILYCRDKLGVLYVRFWDVMEGGLHLSKLSAEGKANFARLDEILDFLVSSGLRPYMELRPKHYRILSSAHSVLHQQEFRRDFVDAEQRTAIFSQLVGHLIRRFGPDEVSTWLFDYSAGQDTAFEDGSFGFTPLEDQGWEEYLDEFDRVAEVLKHRLPKARLGGAGFSIQHYGADGLARLMTRWKQRRHTPDFISVTSFPYQIVKDGERWYERRRTDMRFVSDDVQAARSAMEAGGFGELELHLTECNLTLSDRCCLNDSVIRAAFLANTVIQVHDKVDYFGIWNTRDAYAEFSDSASYLFGGSGILTKSGVAKPAFYALNFLNRLYRGSVSAEDGCLITQNERGHYKLLIHHLVNMNTAYYLKEENQVSPLEIDQLVETNEKKVVHIHVDGLQSPSWQIRRYCLRRDSGSILNEWLNLEVDSGLRSEELSYLEKISTPRMYIQRAMAKNGTLDFDIELEPNEVQYLHITKYD